MPTNGRFRFFAAKHSLPDPANGTSTYPFVAGCLQERKSLSHKASGFCVGWFTRSLKPAPPANAATLITSPGRSVVSSANAATLITSLGSAPFACAV